MRARKRDVRRREKLLAALENSDVEEGQRLAQGSEDPVIRMIRQSLNHEHTSIPVALQMAAGIEMERAGRFLNVLDTLVTLAPLLGLLGTVTGLMRAFLKIGEAELSVVAVTGGIGEALIATACGLLIAIVSLVPLNYFSGKLARLAVRARDRRQQRRSARQRREIEPGGGQMKLGSPVRRKHSRIEIIPLIDIMFFLLASFMMVSLSMDQTQNIKVNLPSATQAQHDFKPGHA